MIRIDTCSAADLIALRKAQEFPESNCYLQAMETGELRLVSIDTEMTNDELKKAGVKFAFYLPGVDRNHPTDVVLGEDVANGILDEMRSRWARGDVGIIS